MSDPYKVVSGGLNLKGIKKKKKKAKKEEGGSKPEKNVEEAKKQIVRCHRSRVMRTHGSAQDEALAAEMTPSERAFLKAQRDRELQRVKSKATKTHKEKVMVSVCTCRLRALYRCPLDHCGRCRSLS